ncbi:MAG: prepilin-type N-terminal cleavage/methylation domain-containing protein [Verrucomicrobiota bacterium]
MNPSSRISPARFHVRSPRGFTLIELLTVVAIIGILAAILIVSMSRVREAAQRSRCLSNLRQIQAANLLHAADNKGYYARVKKGDKWWIVQEDFIRYLNAGKQGYKESHSMVDDIKCPSAVDYLSRASNQWERENFPGYGYRSYGVEVESPGNFTALNQNNVANPAKIMAFADALDFYFYNTPPASYEWDNESKRSTTMSYRHRDGSSVVYFDGHAQWLSRSAIEPINSNKALWGK